MILDYNGYGFTRKGSERFYQDINKQKEEIKKMDLSEDVKNDLLSKTEKLTEEYEISKRRHINSRIFEIRAKAGFERQEKNARKIKSYLEEINDGLEHFKKSNVPGKHLMYRDNSYN